MPNPKYSPAFNRDYELYERLETRYSFNYPFHLEERYQITLGTKSVKRCFWELDSLGKTDGCEDIPLLLNLLRTKASLNFHIKMWAELPQPIHFMNLLEEARTYQFPNWVIEAIYNQLKKNVKRYPSEKPLLSIYKEIDILKELILRELNKD